MDSESKMINYFDTFVHKEPKIIPLLSFMLPLFIRAVPEIIMGEFIVGFDTLNYYIPTVIRWIEEGVSIYEFLGSAPLLYVLLTHMVNVGMPIVITFKLLPPILHGTLGFLIYLYARNVRGWSPKKSLFVTCLATLYFIALRISWDMLRNQLGLIFLFLVLLLLYISQSEKFDIYTLVLSAVMVLVVLSHQLVAVAMFSILFSRIVTEYWNQNLMAVKKLVATSIPALIFLIITIYLYILNPITLGFPDKTLGGWYSLFGYASPLEMMIFGVSFFVFCYLPLLPFVLVEITKSRKIDWISGLMLCGFIAPSIVDPYLSALNIYRWTLMLIFPASFLVIEGLEKYRSQYLKTAYIAILAILSCSFIVLPADMAFPYFTVFPYHVPSSMTQNSVPLRECGDVVNVLTQLRDDILVSGNGKVLTHDAFYGWSLLFLDRSQIVSYRYGDPYTIAQDMVAEKKEQIFMIWWIPGEGWHGSPEISSSFKVILSSNKIAVYEYMPTQ